MIKFKQILNEKTRLAKELDRVENEHGSANASEAKKRVFGKAKGQALKTWLNSRKQYDKNVTMKDAPSSIKDAKNADELRQAISRWKNDKNSILKNGYMTVASLLRANDTSGKEGAELEKQHREEKTGSETPQEETSPDGSDETQSTEITSQEQPTETSSDGSDGTQSTEITSQEGSAETSSEGSAETTSAGSNEELLKKLKNGDDLSKEELEKLIEIGKDDPNISAEEYSALMKQKDKVEDDLNARDLEMQKRHKREKSVADANEAFAKALDEFLQSFGFDSRFKEKATSNKEEIERQHERDRKLIEQERSLQEKTKLIKEMNKSDFSSLRKAQKEKETAEMEKIEKAGKQELENTLSDQLNTKIEEFKNGLEGNNKTLLDTINANENALKDAEEKYSSALSELGDNFKDIDLNKALEADDSVPDEEIVEIFGEYSADDEEEEIKLPVMYLKMSIEKLKETQPTVDVKYKPLIQRLIVTKEKIKTLQDAQNNVSTSKSNLELSKNSNPELVKQRDELLRAYSPGGEKYLETEKNIKEKIEKRKKQKQEELEQEKLIAEKNLKEKVVDVRSEINDIQKGLLKTLRELSKVDYGENPILFMALQNEIESKTENLKAKNEQYNSTLASLGIDVKSQSEEDKLFGKEKSFGSSKPFGKDKHAKNESLKINKYENKKALCEYLKLRKTDTFKYRKEFFERL